MALDTLGCEPTAKQNMHAEHSDFVLLYATEGYPCLLYNVDEYSPAYIYNMQR